MSPTPTSELEDRIRTALRERAATTPVPGSPVPQDAPASSNRRAWHGVTAVAAAALVLIALAWQLASPDSGIRTVPVPPAGEGQLPANGVPRLLVDLPGVVVSSLREGASPLTGPVGEGQRILQWFRQGERLDGPMVFLTTVLPSGMADFGLPGPDDGEPVTVRGVDGVLVRPNGEQGAYDIAVELPDQRALFVTITGMAVDDAVAFLNGLTARPDGGWLPTTLPLGVTEMPTSQLPADGSNYELALRVADATVDINLYQDGFDSRIADRVHSTVAPVETVSIDGVSAALGNYGNNGWWVLLEPDPGRTVEIVIGGADRAAVDGILAAVHFVDEATWDAATNT